MVTAAIKQNPTVPKIKAGFTVPLKSFHSNEASLPFIPEHSSSTSTCQTLPDAATTTLAPVTTSLMVKDTL